MMSMLMCVMYSFRTAGCALPYGADRGARPGFERHILMTLRGIVGG